MDWHKHRTGLFRAGLWTGGTLLALAVILGSLLSISDWSFARGSIESLLSSRLHRDVRIAGPITASLLSTRPSAHIGGITVANPVWAGGRNFAEIGEIDFAIDLFELLTGDLVFDSLQVNEPIVALIRDREGRENFSFRDDDRSNGRDNRTKNRTPDLPAVRQLTLRGGTLYVRDEIHKLTFEGQVEATEHLSRPDDEPFRLVGAGTLNSEPFALAFKGGPLANLRMDQPYSFRFEIDAGMTHADAEGAFAKPFDFATISAALNIHGENLAHLYYLTSLALPFTPPYRLAGEIQSSRQNISVSKLHGKIGSSDIKGTLSVDLAHERPKLFAKLRSQSLNLADLSPAFGKGVRTDSSGDTLDSIAPAALPADKLLPTYRFRFDRLRAMDADVTLHAASIQTTRTPLQEVDINLQLDESVLRIDPLVMTLPQGRVTATVQVDARAQVAQNNLDVRMSDIKLDQFKPKKAAEPPLDGVLHARLQILGTGNSVHEVFATADGQAQAVVPHGEMRKAFAELTGINVARGLGLLLAKDQTRATVRCGVASMNIHDGTANITQLIFDTESVLIKGEGHIELNQEKLDLDIKGHSKELRLGRVRSPITVSGTLRKPTVGIDAGDATKQVGIAALLGTLFTPLSAALAFIDPGLAKDENCAALLAEAKVAQNVNAPDERVPKLALNAVPAPNPSAEPPARANANQGKGNR